VDASTFTRVALKSGGVPIIVTNDNDLTLVGRADGVEIFRVEVIDPATGRYRFTQSGPIDHPDVNESGTADGLRLRVDFVVTDGDGDTATAHVQLDINDSAPTALAVAIAGNEDALIEVVLNADGGADGLQGYVIKSLPTNGKLYSDAAGTAEIAANQTVTGPVYFKPGAQWHGQTTFGYAAIDGDNDQSATVLATINVAAINDAPVLANVQNVSVAEDNVLYLSGLSNKWVASDPDQGDVKTPSVTLTLHVDSGDAVLSAARGGLSGGFIIMVSDGGKTLTITTEADGGSGGRDAYAILNTLLRGDNFAGNNNGIAVTPGPDFNGDVQISWTLNDNGNFGAGGAQTDSGSFTVTVTPVNDAPVIGLGGDTGSVIEPGDPAFIQEAGAGHPSSGGGLGLEPTSNVDLVLAPHIVSGMSVADMTSALADVRAALGAGATDADAIAAAWNYLDTRYTYTDALINEAQAKLSIVYAQYLQSGGMALLDVTAKYTPDGGDAGNTPDRVQSLHDNILGNLGKVGLADKLGAGSDAYLRIEAAVGSDPVLLGLFNDRPVYGGYEGETNQSLAWDIAHGLYPGASGTLVASDVDTALSSLTWSDVTVGAAQYGSFTIDPSSGKWTYVLDPAAADALAAGDSVNEVFTVRVTDDHGAFDTTTVTITVTGSNDAPVISGSTGASFGASGLTGFVEADAALDHKFEPDDNLDGVIAPLMVSGMDMSSVLDQVQTALGTGATRAQAIAQVWDYIDDHGGYYNNLLNEASARLAVEYAKYLQAGGTPLLDVVAKYAPDGTDLGSLPDRLQSLHDNLLGNVHGASLIDKMLGAGQGSNTDPIADVYQNILSLLAANGLSGLLDRPIYSGNEGVANDALAWDQSHGFAPAQAGQMHASDVDAGADLTWSGSGTGTYGVFAIDSVSGKWTYTVDPAMPGFAALTQGQTANESFTVTVTDEFGAKDQHVLTVTATGINDAPVITGDASYTVTEDLSTDIDVLNRLVASGKLTVVDPDAGQSVFQTQTDSTQAYGTFSIDANGNWIYYAYNDSAAIQGLAAGASVSDVVTVLTADGTAQQITITIKGTNDAPVIAAVNPTEFSQNFDSDTSGMFYLGNGASYGGVAIVASGTNSITTADGSSYAVITDVSGAGAFTRFDGYQAVWPGDYTAEVKVYLDTSWSTGEGFDYSVASSDSSGGFLRDFIFHVTKDTSTGKLLVGGSNNTNFAPREDLETLNHYEVTQTGWYTLRHTFKDVGGVLTVDLQLVDVNGTVLWTETRSNPADQIGVNVGGNRYGWFADISLPNGLAVDGVTLNRETADAVVVELADGNPNEGSAVHASSGTIAFGDVDVTDTHTVSAAPAGSGYVGAFTAVLSDDSTGDGTGAISWSFTVADAAIEHLAAGQTLDQVYTVTVTDSAGASDTVDITVTIMGTNDAPVITWNEAGHTSDPSFSFTEGSNSSHWLGAKLAFTDVDLNDTHTLLITPLTTTHPGNVFLGSYAPEVLDADGTGGGAGREVRFNFSVADSDLNFLGAGEVITQTYQVQLRDSAGAVSETRTIYVRFTGTNDAASIAIDTAVADDRSVTEAGGVANGTAGDPWASGKLLVTDVDSGQDAFAVPPSLNATYGTFTFNAATGAWSYALDDARLATQALMQGQMVSDTLTVTSLDGTASHNIVVNIAGTNDAPVITWNEAGHTSDPSFSFT
ncbi:MAG TPA: VCBS domain-containing protein, partial [Xanthobacteraceae bacterium]|nr:VCBS domain-containing protein [Xanthobacteraceae bacterium]